MENVAGGVLQGIITADMVSGVLDEIVGLLPVIIPVMIGFIGLRKGISFLQGVLHSAWCSQPNAPVPNRGISYKEVLKNEFQKNRPDTGLLGAGLRSGGEYFAD